MNSQEFQAAYSQIENLGTHLLQYLQEIQAGRSKEGDAGDYLASIEQDLDHIMNKLRSQSYRVTVVAAMKAGKSTFLNAMIGANVLASETAACTVFRTDIHHIENDQTPELLEYRSASRHPVSLIQGSSLAIQPKFLERTHQVREQNNPDETTHFELRHPIEAISNVPALSGFTLVDTPGPNEWKSVSFDTAILKQTALEAIRAGDAVLFVLDYTSYKDNAVSELFHDVLEGRKEILSADSGKLYFILNKIDQRGEGDPLIEETIKNLSKDLETFGFSSPQIYPVSARKGLLAKLIIANSATPEEIKDFKNFFVAPYAKENEEGDMVIPGPKKIAPQALKDSGIPAIEESVIRTIVKKSGRHLLQEVLAGLQKTGKAVEDSINSEIAGWDKTIEQLRELLEDYEKKSAYAQDKVKSVQNKVEEQKNLLMQSFGEGINIFVEESKQRFSETIEEIAEFRRNGNQEYRGSKDDVKSHQTREVIEPATNLSGHEVGGLVDGIADAAGEVVGFFDRKIGAVIKGIGTLMRVVISFGSGFFNNDETRQIFIDTDGGTNFDPYKVRCSSKEEAESVEQKINDYFGPSLQKWWLDTQDLLVREGTQIRKDLCEQISQEIQEISNELSAYLGKNLNIQLNINSIQFPDFDFVGLDQLIQSQQETQRRTKTERRTESSCCHRKTYEVKIKYDETVHCVDLQELKVNLEAMVDHQAEKTKEMLEGVVNHQVTKDFKSANRQIQSYIRRFQRQFEDILQQKEDSNLKKEEIQSKLSEQLLRLQTVLDEISAAQQSLKQLS